jgi:hypothetical protein
MQLERKLLVCALVSALTACSGQVNGTSGGTRGKLTVSSHVLSDMVGVAQATTPADINWLVQLGVKYVRNDITWKDMQKSRSAPIVFTGSDAMVGAAQASKIKVLGVLDYSNPWANKGSAICKLNDDKVTPDDPADFANFAKQVVQHYDLDTFAGTVFAYEVWNEENIGWRNWKHIILDPSDPYYCLLWAVDDPAEYGRLLASTVAAVNSVPLRHARPLIANGGTVYLPEPTPPGITDVAGGVNGNRAGNDYLADVFRLTNGLGPTLTAATFHGYTAYPPVSPPEAGGNLVYGEFEVQLGDKISLTRTMFSNAHVSGPLFMTEVGWATKPSPVLGPHSAVPLHDQATFLIRTILLSALNGLDQLYIYNLHDDKNNTYTEGGFGLLNDAGAPKESFNAIRFLLNTFGQSHVLDRVSLGDPNHSAYDIELENPKGGQLRCHAAWDSAGNKGYGWIVPSGYSVVAMDGSVVQPSNGMVVLDGTPIYACPNAITPPPPPADHLSACNNPGDYSDQIKYSSTSANVISYCDDSRSIGEYQCDQFVNRYMSSLNLPPVDNWVDNLACEICDLVNNDPNLNRLYWVYGPGYRSTAGHQPAPNDLLVWQESGCSESDKYVPGHVAVVTATHSSYLEYIQQNWIVSASVNGSAYATLARSTTPWNGSSSFFGHAGGPGGTAFFPKCWVHLECPPGTSCNPGPGHNPCQQVPHSGNGQFCGKCSGSQCQYGFNPAVADPNIVYECFDGEVANEKHCSNGCFVASQGTPDDCNTADPCGPVPGTANGMFCSNNNHQYGFNPSDTAYPNTLYHCVNGRTADLVTCHTGCNPAPSGSPDQCNDDPCTHVSGTDNGGYCGNTPSPLFNTSVADPNVAYTCVNGHAVDTVWCGDYGCYNASNGTPDRCNEDPCTGVSSANNGVFCGRSNQFGFNPHGTAGDTTLYYCENGHSKWAQICARGCYLAPAGIVDGCL